MMPASVGKYLLARERRVITVRQHPAVLIPPIARALGGLLVAWVMSAAILYGNKTLLILIWILSVSLFLRLIFNATSWIADYFVVTSERFISISGSALTRKIESLPLPKVTDINLERSSAGRLLGYGKFVIDSVGQHPRLRNINYVPYPEQIYLEICGLVFPDTNRNDGLPHANNRDVRDD
jgi:hypothetical protein